jgi:para-nitrobenzyl esterase
MMKNVACLFFAILLLSATSYSTPQPAEKWEGVKPTTEYAPAAFQGGNPPSGKSEDCLYLNVWSPAESAKKRIPVLVWIYGGGFSFGSTAEPVYTGKMLVRKGVVYASIAYRVGPLGFLGHPELSAESPHQVSGNYGLLDMIAGDQYKLYEAGQYNDMPVLIGYNSDEGISFTRVNTPDGEAWVK